jgi:hypothetical protein
MRTRYWVELRIAPALITRLRRRIAIWFRRDDAVARGTRRAARARQVSTIATATTTVKSATSTEIPSSARCVRFTDRVSQPVKVRDAVLEGRMGKHHADESLRECLKAGLVTVRKIVRRHAAISPRGSCWATKCRGVTFLGCP